MLHKNSDNFISINHAWIDRLAKDAQLAQNHMGRLLMHNSPDDAVQEMLIALARNCAVKPNRSKGKSESLQVLRGDLTLVVYSDDGEETDRISMSAHDEKLPFLYRFNSTPWHTMIPISDVVVVHEVLQGPFVKSNEEEPAWVAKVHEALQSVMAA